ncbi:MAG TPA: Gfo/Idh/MocA family oxidoreductase, partial [bacterium]|nr:Gfo/Idh/MocA family oxidoreductase [bacterium]
LLRRGFHLLIEKPITVTVAEARELHRVAEERKVVIQVGHVERFNPAVLAVEKILRPPRFIECHRLAPYQPRGTEVSVVLDLMIHDLEIILHLVASPVESLEAVGMPVLSPSEDIANARIRFRSGCIANVTASRITPHRMRKIRIFQDDGYISLDYNEQRAEVYRLEAGRICREVLATRRQEPLKLELQSFVESVRLGGLPQVPAEHGLGALKLANDILTDAARARKKLARLKTRSREE